MENWVTEILDQACEEVRSWPNWMRRREICCPEDLTLEILKQEKVLKDRNNYS